MRYEMSVELRNARRKKRSGCYMESLEAEQEDGCSLPSWYPTRTMATVKWKPPCCMMRGWKSLQDVKRERRGFWSGRGSARRMLHGGWDYTVICQQDYEEGEKEDGSDVRRVRRAGGKGECRWTALKSTDWRLKT